MDFKPKVVVAARLAQFRNHLPCPSIAANLTTFTLSLNESLENIHHMIDFFYHRHRMRDLVFVPVMYSWRINEITLKLVEATAMQLTDEMLIGFCCVQGESIACRVFLTCHCTLKPC